MEHFITAAVFNYPHEITILKHLLQDEGLQYYFENETIADLLPLYSYALGGIKLRVHPDDFDAVHEILDKLDTGTHLKIV
jgi:hypothetical protein